MALSLALLPAASLAEQVEAEVVAAEWVRKVETYRLNGGKSPVPVFAGTVTARGTFQDDLRWPRIEDATVLVRSRSQFFTLIVRDPRDGKRTLISAPLEVWDEAAMSGSVLLTRDASGALTLP